MNHRATKTLVRSALAHHEPDAWSSLREFPAQLIADLPSGIELHLAVPGAPVRVRIRLAPAPAIKELPSALASSIEFDADELRALVLGVEADRLWHREFLGFCFEKWRNPSFRVTQADALAGVNPDEQVSWTIERVLQRLQATVSAVSFVADQAETQHALRSAA